MHHPVVRITTRGNDFYAYPFTGSEEDVESLGDKLKQSGTSGISVVYRLSSPTGPPILKQVVLKDEAVSLPEFKDDKAKEQLDLIHRSAKKLNRLVDELLDISKIEAGEMKLKACQVNIVSVVKEMALSFHSLAERKRITFKLNSDADKITVYIDKDKFDKILSNVLSNAFKFTPEGGKVEIEIEASPKSPPKEGT